MSRTTFDPNLKCNHCGKVVGDEFVIDGHVNEQSAVLFTYTESGHQIVYDPADGVSVSCPDYIPEYTDEPTQVDDCAECGSSTGHYLCCSKSQIV